MNVRHVVLPAAVAASALALAGCGGSSGSTPAAAPVTTPASTPSSAPATVVAPTQTSTVTAAPTHSASPTTPTGTPQCATSQLRFTLGASQGAAGHFEQPLVLTNTSQTTCTLYGYPGVSYTASGGAQVGYSASRTGGSAHQVTLAANGGQASALLSQPDPGVFAPGSCKPAKYLAIRLYPPGQRDALAANHSGTVCTTKQARSDVSVVQKGTNPTD